MTDVTNGPPESHREVRRRRIAAGEARTALIRRRYDASIEDVWEACTDAERMSRWFIKPSGDLRVGGKFRREGIASGEILRCEPPRLLRVTWAYGDMPVDEVELRLSPGGHGDTVLELEHASVSPTAPDGATDAILGFGTGWEMALDYLERHFQGELPYTPGQEPAQQGFEPTPEDLEREAVRAQAWAAAVEAANTARRTESAAEQQRP